MKGLQGLEGTSRDHQNQPPSYSRYPTISFTGRCPDTPWISPNIWIFIRGQCTELVVAVLIMLNLLMLNRQKYGIHSSNLLVLFNICSPQVQRRELQRGKFRPARRDNMWKFHMAMFSWEDYFKYPAEYLSVYFYLNTVFLSLPK